MPDITMCPGTDCPKKETCYRFMATPSYYQSYFVELPMKNGECDHYWEYVKPDANKKKKKVKQ